MSNTSYYDHYEFVRLFEAKFGNDYEDSEQLVTL